MAKLTNLKPRFGSAAPKLTAPTPINEQQRFQLRDTTSPWRAWYKTSRWQKLRMQVILRDRFTCQMCGRLQPATNKLVCDHVRPHRGDEQIFWDMANLQTLCADPCHNVKKQQQEAKMPAGVWY